MHRNRHLLGTDRADCAQPHRETMVSSEGALPPLFACPPSWDERLLCDAVVTESARAHSYFLS